MLSKRELEGYLMIDHRAGEGITPQEAQTANVHGLKVPVIPVERGKMFESPTINCSHCERLVVLNPDRSRSRGYCPKCDRYLCDDCEFARVQTGICRPFKQLIDEYIDDAANGRIVV
jgi:hypothetical protein